MKRMLRFDAHPYDDGRMCELIHAYARSRGGQGVKVLSSDAVSIWRGGANELSAVLPFAQVKYLSL